MKQRYFGSEFSLGLEERGTEDSESAGENLLAVKTSKKSADLLGGSALTAPSVALASEERGEPMPTARKPLHCGGLSEGTH